MFSTENYRLQSKYENHLIGKVALFQFVNSFLSLFYIAFYLRDQEKLKEQLAGLLISRQIIGNLRETAYPYFMEQLKLAKISFNMWGALSPTQETMQPLIPDDKQVSSWITIDVHKKISACHHGRCKAIEHKQILQVNLIHPNRNPRCLWIQWKM